MRQMAKRLRAKAKKTVVLTVKIKSGNFWLRSNL
jgi:hypothetical protein